MPRLASPARHVACSPRPTHRIPTLSLPPPPTPPVAILAVAQDTATVASAPAAAAVAPKAASPPTPAKKRAAETEEEEERREKAATVAAGGKAQSHEEHEAEERREKAAKKAATAAGTPTATKKKGNAEDDEDNEKDRAKAYTPHPVSSFAADAAATAALKRKGAGKDGLPASQLAAAATSLAPRVVRHKPLTDAETARVKTAFNISGNAPLSKATLAALAANRTALMFALADENGDGEVTQQEYLAYAQRDAPKGTNTTDATVPASVTRLFDRVAGAGAAAMNVSAGEFFFFLGFAFPLPRQRHTHTQRACLGGGRGRETAKPHTHPTPTPSPPLSRTVRRRRRRHRLLPGGRHGRQWARVV